MITHGRDATFALLLKEDDVCRLRESLFEPGHEAVVSGVRSTFERDGGVKYPTGSSSTARIAAQGASKDGADSTSREKVSRFKTSSTENPIPWQLVR